MTRFLRTAGGIVATLAVLAFAAAFLWALWRYYMVAPWTRDGLVHADVVALAPDVSGLVSEVPVRENQAVKKGDVVIRIDPRRFEIALAQAQAEVENKKASSDEAVSMLQRYEGAGELAVTQEAVANQRYATAIAKAAYDQALADRDLAQLNLDRAQVRASVNGVVTNFSVRPGDYVTAGKGVFALVDSDSYAVDGFFEETKIGGVRVGDEAIVTLMGGPTYKGRVQGIAAAISGDIANDGNLLPNVNPVFNWVRLARRVPVRITLENLPQSGGLIAGRTATVEIVQGK